MKQLLSVAALLALSTSPAFAAKPTWAKKATAFPSECDPNAKGSYEHASLRTALSLSTAPCKPLRIPAPDGKSSVEVRYRKSGENLGAYLLVTTPGRGTRETELPYGFQDVDLLWSPDSKAFFVNGGNGGGYWGFWVYVYRVDDSKLEPRDLTQEAQRDMVRSFPPCRATWLDLKTCKAIESNPDYNMTGIDWVGDSSAVVVMAEVPCSGAHGGIMCQVLGYELEVSTGKILRRMTARQFAAKWQKSMAWKFEVPQAPEYCDKLPDRKLARCAERNW